MKDIQDYNIPSRILSSVSISVNSLNFDDPVHICVNAMVGTGSIHYTYTYYIYLVSTLYLYISSNHWSWTRPLVLPHLPDSGQNCSVARWTRVYYYCYQYLFIFLFISRSTYFVVEFADIVLFL